MQQRPYLVLSTVSSKKEAKKIADMLVRKKLAACVNIVPNVSSIFKWKGKVDQTRELLLVIKTDAQCFKRLEQTIRKNHSYQIPEIIGIPIGWGYRAYLNWINQSIKS
ncbi:MAG: divalent-cation tolerance protein CutA [Candidatus Omnitrophica bacterium]|nr:divalent-cation tolerance protein CutA [Candidatus Omnitrophota bacterium]